jgi:hypothetical protein
MTQVKAFGILVSGWGGIADFADIARDRKPLSSSKPRQYGTRWDDMGRRGMNIGVGGGYPKNRVSLVIARHRMIESKRLRRFRNAFWLD